MSEIFTIEPRVEVYLKNVIYNPDDAFFINFLKPYYVFTRDGQYLFGSTQVGRRPDRAFYIVPDNYKLGKKQQKFDTRIGKRIFEVAMNYLNEEQPPLIIQEGIQGEHGYEVELRLTLSIKNPHSAYIAWMGKMMVFPPKNNMNIHCWNYVIQEKLPDKYIKEIQKVWPEYDPSVPLTLYDFTEMDKNIRRVLSLGIDYFGGAFKKPNLTMVWNKAEADGLISYHAGCTSDRVLKGLSGTGKTTLTVGPELEQDDACLGKPIYNDNNKIIETKLIGLEAASFAKSQGLNRDSPEYPGLMKSREITKDGKRPIVLAMNIDCEGVEYVTKKINGYEVKIPQQIPGEEVGSLQCTKYEKSHTTNGRFIFLFSELNPGWGKGCEKSLKSEALSYKKYDILEPIFRVVDAKMAVALDSACESIITSAISAQKPGTRVRSYAATDFMAREQSHQALLKLKMYQDMDLDMNGKLVFFINNAGFIGEYDFEGNQIKKLDEKGEPIPKIDSETGDILKNELGKIIYEGQGAGIKVADSKRLIDLVEHRKIEKWIRHPIFGYLIPDPKELEQKHGMKNFGKRFNPLNYYTPDEYLKFIKRNIRERTEFLENLFMGQEGEEKLKDIINIWKNCRIPSEQEIKRFYDTNY
ncbi:MAG: phosphoenolpyruvate carboxykinase (ATP) [Thermoplasmatales archaeon]|nr:MAG: phosphoenolpyruvate carboxykinase (ATP) [Thermoplasmatales archaeon]